MTVLRIKQLVAAVTTWGIAMALVLALGVGGMVVVVTGSGADPGDAFTDPLRAQDASVLWADGTMLDAKTQIELADLWRTAMTQRIDDVEDGQVALGVSTLEVRSISPNSEFIQLRGAVQVSRLVNDLHMLTIDVFDVDVLQQPAGWHLLNVELNSS